jgi:pilus assembly protein CpaB
MGKWKAIIPLIAALVIASGGSLFLYKWLQARATPVQVVKVETQAVPVVVATADLPWGTKLKPEMMTMVPFLKESLPSGYASDTAGLVGRVTIMPLKRNEPVVEARLAPENITTGGVSAVVKPGKRAIAVKGDKVIGISGFIQPGNHVDVLVTLTEPKSKIEVTKMVLDNILVLATGTEIQQNADGKPAPVDVYTLEVGPEDGEKLALAAAQGKLQFALRNVTDTNTVLTEGATITETLASLRKPQAPAQKVSKTWKAPAKAQAQAAKFTVEEIKGSTVSQKSFD